MRWTPLGGADQRHRDDGGAGLGTGAEAALDHLTAELVAHHHRLGRAHEAVVAGDGGVVGELVAVVAGVQVGAADAARDDVEHELAAGRRGLGDVGDLEPAGLADERPHGVGRPELAEQRLGQVEDRRRGELVLGERVVRCTSSGPSKMPHRPVPAVHLGQRRGVGDAGRRRAPGWRGR